MKIKKNPPAKDSSKEYFHPVEYFLKQTKGAFSSSRYLMVLMAIRRWSGHNLKTLVSNLSREGYPLKPEQVREEISFLRWHELVYESDNEAPSTTKYHLTDKGVDYISNNQNLILKIIQLLDSIKGINK